MAQTRVSCRLPSSLQCTIACLLLPDSGLFSVQSSNLSRNPLPPQFDLVLAWTASACRTLWDLVQTEAQALRPRSSLVAPELGVEISRPVPQRDLTPVLRPSVALRKHSYMIGGLVIGGRKADRWHYLHQRDSRLMVVTPTTFPASVSSIGAQ